MTRVAFPVRLALAVPVLALFLAFGGAPALAQYANVEIVVKDKKFEPAEVKAPANARIVIRVINKGYFVALTLTPNANLGKGRYLLRLLAPKLADELAA